MKIIEIDKIYSILILSFYHLRSLYKISVAYKKLESCGSHHMRFFYVESPSM